MVTKRLHNIRIQGPTRPAVLVLPEHDHITNVVLRYNTYYEIDLLNAIRAQKRSGVYVDVGAHYGNHTTYFALECSSTRVVSIEANPETYSGLVNTISANGLVGKVTSYNLAIHPIWKKVKSMIPDTANTGTGMVKEELSGNIDARPLDEVLANIENIAVIKSDAQYLDDLVIRSGINTIKKWKPLLSVEACTVEEVAVLQDILGPLGYRKIGTYASSPTHLWTI